MEPEATVWEPPKLGPTGALLQPAGLVGPLDRSLGAGLCHGQIDVGQEQAVPMMDAPRTDAA